MRKEDKIRPSEKKARYIISQIGLAVKDHFTPAEKPDWQNVKDDIGLEVTEDKTNIEGEIDGTVKSAIKNGTSYEELIKRDKKNMLDGEVFRIGDTYVAIHSVDPQTRFLHSIESKLKKLNKHFKLFSQNWLFISTVFILDTTIIEKDLVPKIQKLHSEIKTVFDKYILCDDKRVIVLTFNKDKHINTQTYDITL